MPMIKALFLDIDGTLVSFQTHCIPASAVEAMRESVPEIQRSMAELATAIRRLTT